MILAALAKTLSDRTSDSVSYITICLAATGITYRKQFKRPFARPAQAGLGDPSSHSFLEKIHLCGLRVDDEEPI